VEQNSSWDRNWKEREDALEGLFGVSHPPGSPAGYVISLKLFLPEDWPDLMIPGACVKVFPPAEERDPRPPPVYGDLDGWLYLTVVLSQPLDGAGRWHGVGLAREDDRGFQDFFAG
jgi:hypothetical protein